MIIDMHDLEEFGKEGNNEDDEGSFDIVPRTSADVMIDNPPKQVRPATLPQSRPELPRDLSTKSPMTEIDTSDRMHLYGVISVQLAGMAPWLIWKRGVCTAWRVLARRMRRRVVMRVAGAVIRVVLTIT